MAIIATNKDSGSNDSTVSSQTTNSVAFQNNRLYLVTVTARSNGTPTISGITGGGITWVQIGSTSTAAPFVAVYRGLVTSGATTGALTITLGASCTSNKWAIDEFQNVDTTGTNGSGAIVQSASVLNHAAATSGSITLAAFGDATNNAAWGFFSHNQGSETSTIDPDSGWAALANNGTAVTPAVSTMTEWKLGQDLSVDASWATSGAWAGWAAEIKAAAGGTTFNQTLAVVSSQTIGIQKQVNKGGLAVVGAQTVGIQKQVSKFMSVVGAQTVAVQKQVAKKLAVVGAQTVGLVPQIVKLVTLAVVGSQTVSFQKQVNKVVAVTGAQTLAFQKNVSKGIAVVGSATTTVVKQVSKTMAVVGSEVVAIAHAITFTKALAVVGTQTVAFQRQVNKGLAVVSAQTVAFQKQVNKAIAVVGSATVKIVKSVTKTLAVVSSGTALVVKLVSKRMAVTGSALVAIVTAITRFIPGLDPPNRIWMAVSKNVINLFSPSNRADTGTSKNDIIVPNDPNSVDIEEA